MRISSWVCLLAAFLLGCASSGDYRVKGAQAVVDKRYVEAAAAYKKAADIARSEGNTFIEADSLRDAADALATLAPKNPQDADAVIALYRRAQELYPKGWVPDIRGLRPALAGLTSYGIANMYASSSRPVEAAQNLLDVLRSCIGDAADNGFCYFALDSGAKLANTISETALAFEFRLQLLQGSNLQSRILGLYDPLNAEAQAIGLHAQAEQIRQAKAALVAVEGRDPNPSAYISADPAELQKIAFVLKAQADEYARRGIHWLALLRSAQASEALKDIRQMAQNARLSAEIYADIERNKAQTRASREQSWDTLSRLLAVRAAGGAKPATASTPAARVSNPPSVPNLQSGQPTGTAGTTVWVPGEVWDTNDHSHCVEILRVASAPTSNLQKYGYRNACTYPIKIWVDDGPTVGAFGGLFSLQPGQSQESWWLLSTRLTIDRVVCRAYSPDGQEIHLNKGSRRCYFSGRR